ncbi:MAG TPA: dTDP-4-dehydrorhamnose 3,5-epimerase [Planctomycetota bacterium]|nr:dTDP-4-dehydrorhamnose 3,5-epimerase [Planctomycetota bacterium]
MKFSPTELEGAVIIEPEVHRDARGFFLETYHARKYEQGGLPAVFVQDNHTRSARGTLRGMHAQRHRPQGKLVRVIEGEIFDVAADLRKGSPTFGRWISVVLSAENFKQLYVPPGFVHGFAVTSEAAEVEYKCTDFYDPSDELGVIWNDPDLAIRWPFDDPVLSRKDQSNPRLADVLELLAP